MFFGRLFFLAHSYTYLVANSSVTKRFNLRYIYMVRRITYLFFTLCLSISTFHAQDGDVKQLRQVEQKLAEQLSELRKTRADEKIKTLNASFKETFSEALNIDGAFSYPFKRLKSVGKIYSDDELVRIISWNTQFENKLHDYHCFIMKKDERRDRVYTTSLTRKKQPLQMLTRETIDHENWYGALYYDIIDVQKRNRTYYTLLGYDPNDQRSSIKLIDVLYFTGKFPNFGYPLFETENGFSKRVIFEHSNQATMSLRYDKKREKIIFDHLSPESPSMKEFREYYVPDMSYDAYEFKDNKWYLLEDIIAINKEEKEVVELKAYDAENDTVVTYEKDNKWKNPEGEGAPASGGSHKSALPEDLTKKEKEKRRKKKNKPSKKSFKGVSFTNLGKGDN